MTTPRTHAKLIRFHPDELRQITESARRAGLTPARFIRETALGVVPKARRTSSAGPQLRELARIGRSLDQLTRTGGNASPALADRLREALDGHTALVREIVERGRQNRGPSR